MLDVSREMSRTKERGQSIILVLIGVALLSTVIMSFTGLIGAFQKQASFARNIVVYNSLLNSAIDHTIYGIQNMWCFDDTWLNDKLSPCDLNHSRSVERLLMSDDSVRAVNEMMLYNAKLTAGQTAITYNLPGGSPVLGQIDLVVPTATLTSVHPLFLMVQSAGNTFDQIHFNIKRVSNFNAPQQGKEIYLKITVTLQSSGGFPLWKGLTSLTAVSTVIAAPRELNSFALVVPHDLHLDLNSGDSATGNFNIPSGAAAGNGGMLFQSPVFVNGNIYLPTTGNYTDATFTQPVFIGNGQVLQGATPYTPATPGGKKNQKWTQSTVFGGFLGGLHFDGVQDNGLNVWVGGAAAANAATIAQCANHIAVRSNLRRTKQSSHLIKPADPAGVGTSLQYTIALSNEDMYLPQTVPPNVTAISPTLTSAVMTPVTTPPIPPKVHAEIKFYPDPVTALAGAPTYYIRADLGAHPLSATGTNVKITFPTGAVFNFNLIAHVANGVAQPHQEDVKISTAPGASGFPLDAAYVVVKMDAFDLAAYNGNDRRTPSTAPVVGALMANDYDDQYSRTTYLSYTMDPLTGTLTETPNLSSYPSSPTAPGYVVTFLPTVAAEIGTAPTGWASALPAPITNPGGIDYDYASLDELCQKPLGPGGDVLHSFGIGGWDEDYSANTRAIWNFSDHDDVPKTSGKNHDPNSPDDSVLVTYPKGLSYPAPSPQEFIIDDTNDTDFQNMGIIGTCRVTKKANTLYGFLACDKFIIDKRNSQLNIMATVIAGSASVDSTALKFGIVWRSMQHPQAVQEMKTSATSPLNKHRPKGLCDVVPVKNPQFASHGGVDKANYQRLCEPDSLTETNIHFKWTQVDPDCGYTTAGDDHMKCKYRPRHFIVKEVARVSDI